MDIIRMTWCLIQHGNPVVDCLGLCMELLAARYIDGSEVTITRQQQQL
jgi:hypothetical protein